MSCSQKSMKLLVINNFQFTNKEFGITLMKIHVDIEISMWYLKKGVILIKDNLNRRNWNGVKLAA